MNIKRLFLGLFASALLAQSAQAVPADPRPRRVMQADGTYITLVTRGDEYGHVTMTTDGYPVCFSAAAGRYEYASLVSGELQPSGIAAADAPQRNAAARAFLKNADVSGMLAAASAWRASKVRKMRYGVSSPTVPGGPRRAMLINDYPTVGSPNVLVLLVQFSDMTFDCEDGDPKGYYENMFNKPGFTYKNGARGSVSDYFTASSNGLFKPHFDIVGPVTLPKSYSYYGKNTSGGDRMDRLQEFVKASCEAASGLVDFSKYDNNGDGMVDNVYLYYAGFGEADSEYSNSIWPHSYNYSNFQAGSLEFNGVQIDSYTCSQERNGSYPELPVGIGTFCHEFSHVLGLPDHYCTVYNDAFTPGEYDVMDVGSYNNNQNTPPTHSAYERAELGWLEYADLDTDADTISVLPDVKDSNRAYRIPVAGTSGREFFVLENRQKKGWDAYIPGHGMLMWHIDQNRAVWDANTVNNDASHQRVDIVEADGRPTSMTTSGDPFPGKSNVTQWTMTAWDGSDVLRLDNIEEVSDTIRLLVAGTNFSIATPDARVSEVADSSVVVEWGAVERAKKYVLSVYRMNDGERTAVDGYESVAFGEPTAYRIEGLEPDADYEVELTAQLNSYVSAPAVLSVHTAPLAFAKRRPGNLEPTEVGTEGFRLSWDAVETADDYVVALNSQEFGSDAVARGYDFSERGQGMPPAWSYSGAWMGVKKYCGQAAPSLQMSKAGNFLCVAYRDARLSSLGFYLTSTQGASGSVGIERWKNGEWMAVDSIAIGADFQSGVRSYEFEASDSVRIVFDRNAGSVFVDDVEVGCHDVVRQPVAGYESVYTGGNTEFSFTGLRGDTRYGVVVVALNGGERSLESSELTVTTLVPTTVRAIGADTGDGVSAVYDISGRRVADVSSAHGVYIVRKGGKARKTVK